MKMLRLKQMLIEKTNYKSDFKDIHLKLLNIKNLVIKTSPVEQMTW